MIARIEEPIILSDQFFARILTDIAKSLVRIGNCALGVGDGHDGVLVECVFLLAQLFESVLRGGEALLHNFRAFGNTSFQIRIAPAQHKRPGKDYHGERNRQTKRDDCMSWSPPGRTLDHDHILWRVQQDSERLGD
jgi:hypothetical protein